MILADTKFEFGLHNGELILIDEILTPDSSRFWEENDIKKYDSKANENISFIKDSYLQYNRIDPNKTFDSFILGSSNRLAFEASKKVSQDISHYNPLYIYGGVGIV